jgi:hypothetical protein
MKHKKRMVSVFLALLVICALISSSTNIIAAFKYRDDGYELIDIGPIDLDTTESPKPSDTTVTEKTQPTDTTESVGLINADTNDSVRPKTTGISLVKIPKSRDDLELFACVLMLLMSCFIVMGFALYDKKRDSDKYRS